MTPPECWISGGYGSPLRGARLKGSPRGGRHQPLLSESPTVFVHITLSPCTPRGQGEGSPCAASQLSPLSACGLRNCRLSSSEPYFEEESPISARLSSPEPYFEDKLWLSLQSAMLRPLSVSTTAVRGRVFFRLRPRPVFLNRHPVGGKVQRFNSREEFDSIVNEPIPKLNFALTSSEGADVLPF